MNRPASLLFLALACCSKPAPPALFAPAEWPPRLDQPYPDLELVDQTGAKVKLSSFKGKVIVVEPVGMNCPACQAFAGAHRVGSFQGVAPQGGLDSFEEYAAKGGVAMGDVIFVQLLLYSMSMQAPTLDDARAWASHFRMDRAKNRIVLAGTPPMIGQASYAMIPGFQLIDRKFVLRSDSSGHNPKHNLWNHLIPMIPRLMNES